MYNMMSWIYNIPVDFTHTHRWDQSASVDISNQAGQVF